jgi:hypothetical protein
LTGTIPSTLTALTRLTFLDLSNNALTGTIPPIPIVPMHVDNAVDLSSNRLVGSVPSTFTSLNYKYLGRYVGPGQRAHCVVDIDASTHQQPNVAEPVSLTTSATIAS